MPPLETGDFIADLNPTNPPGSDLIQQGDDHLRLVKKTVQQSFPNVDGIVTRTDVQLENTGDMTAAEAMTGRWSQEDPTAAPRKLGFDDAPETALSGTVTIAAIHESRTLFAAGAATFQLDDGSGFRVGSAVALLSFGGTISLNRINLAELYLMDQVTPVDSNRTLTVGQFGVIWRRNTLQYYLIGHGQ